MGWVGVWIRLSLIRSSEELSSTLNTYVLHLIKLAFLFFSFFLGGGAGVVARVAGSDAVWLFNVTSIHPCKHFTVRHEETS